MTKRETHLIESSNSSIRDNLARFNRRTKRFSKSLFALKDTLKLFFIKTFYLKQYLFDTPTVEGDSNRARECCYMLW